MDKNRSEQNSGSSMNPSEGSQTSAAPQQQSDKEQPLKEGEYKNIETSVNNRSYFGEDYAVEQEEAMGQEEADTEDENHVPNRRRGDS